MSGTIIAVISDTHIGSTTALAPPRFAIHGGRDPDEVQLVEYNAHQRWLYTCWEVYWQAVREKAGIRGKHRRNRLFIFHLGDVVDGLHHGSVQVMNETDDQIEAACILLRPLAALADGMWITYGTGAHNGGAAEHEVTIGGELGVHHGWDFSLDVDGVVFDILHTGRAAQRDWTGSAAGLAIEVARDYQKDGKMAPRFVLRGHVHRIDDTGWKLPDCRATTLPSWQLRTVYGHAVAANQRRSDIGAAIYDTSDPDNPTLLRFAAPGGFIRTETV
jgi:hypothetical protein